MSDESGPVHVEELVYEETGEPAGWREHYADGSVADFDTDGAVSQIYEPEPDDPEVAEKLADYAERMDNIEQQLAQPRQAQFETVLDAPDEARLSADFLQQREHAEKALGFKFSLDERRAIGQKLADQVMAGNVRGDVVEALGELEAEGYEFPDPDDPHRGRAHEARTARWAGRMEDGERYAAHEAGLDDLGPVPPAKQEDFDRADRQERQDGIVARLRGQVGPESWYDSTDYAQED